MEYDACKTQMQSIIDHFKQELTGIQAGKARRELVEHINVQANYGTMPIGQLANISVVDHESIKIEPWDKSVGKAMEQAIYDAQNGLVPNNEGDFIWVKVPPLTKERKEQIKKQVSEMGEQTKTSLRQTRHERLKTLKKQFENEEISEDEKNIGEDNVNDLIHEFNEKVDTLVKAKSESL